MGHIMAEIDKRTFFASLGFLAVILNDTPKGKQPQRAALLAQLIEEFCSAPISEINKKRSTQELIKSYIAELRDNGSARLDHDRKTLLDMYEMLLVEKVWHDQREFFLNGHEDIIANRILQLVEEKMQWGTQS